jgi:hypothetical protein
MFQLVGLRPSRKPMSVHLVRHRCFLAAAHTRHSNQATGAASDELNFAAEIPAVATGSRCDH